jgi:hypothetical protein
LYAFLACEGLRRCRVDLQVLLDNVEDGAIIKIVNLLPRCSARQATFNSCGDIMSGQTIGVDRVTRHGGRSLHAFLACEGLHRCRVDLQVLLDNVEDRAIIKIIDAHEIAHLLLLVNAPHTLSCHNTGEMVPAVVCEEEQYWW